MSDINKRKSISYLYQRASESESVHHKFKQVSSISPDEACVLVLGGSGAVKGDEREVNGYAKIVRTVLDKKGFADNVGVYSVAYDFGDFHKAQLARQLLASGVKDKASYIEKKEEADAVLKIGFKENIDETVARENIAPNYVTDIFNKAFLPRISKKDEDGKLTRIDAQEAMRNIRKMTVVAHCHGAYVAMKIEGLMQKKMDKLGYSKDEQKDIQKQMVVLSQAPACKINNSTASTMVSLVSAVDIDMGLFLNLTHRYLNRKSIKLDNEILSDQESDLDTKLKQQRKQELLDIPMIYMEKERLFIARRAYVDDFNSFGRENHYFLYNNNEGMNFNGKRIVAISRLLLKAAVENSLSQEEKVSGFGDKEIENAIGAQLVKRLKRNNEIVQADMKKKKDRSLKVKSIIQTKIPASMAENRKKYGWSLKRIVQGR